MGYNRAKLLGIGQAVRHWVLVPGSGVRIPHPQPSSAPKETCVDRHKLFLETVKELKLRSSSQEYYDNLMSAGLLAKLLLDGHSLVDEVNRTARLKIRYRIVKQNPPAIPNLVFWAAQDGIDPNDQPPGSPSPEELSLDDMLKVPLMIYGGQEYNVAESINFLRNKAGAVHIGPSNSDKDKVLGDATQPVARSMKAVARVVLNSLEPLIKVIRSN